MDRTCFRSVVVALGMGASLACETYPDLNFDGGACGGGSSQCVCSSNGQSVAKVSDCPGYHGSITHETSGADIVASIGSTQVAGPAWGTGGAALSTDVALSMLHFSFWNGEAGGEGMNQVGLWCMGTTASALNAAKTLKDACTSGATLWIYSDTLAATVGQDLTAVPTSLSAQANIDAGGHGTLSIRIDVPQFMAQAASLKVGGHPATMLISISNLEAMVTFGDSPDSCRPPVCFEGMW